MKNSEKNGKEEKLAEKEDLRLALIPCGNLESIKGKLFLAFHSFIHDVYVQNIQKKKTK